MKRLHQKLSEHSKHYAAWHNWQGHKAIHWAAFAVVALVVSIGIYSQLKNAELETLKTYAQSTAPVSYTHGTVEAATAGSEQQISEYTLKLLNISKAFKKASATEKASLLVELTTLAKNRQALLSELMKSNPKASLNQGLNTTLRAQLPLEIRSLIEERKIVRGKFEALHIHFGEFDRGHIEDFYYVTESGTGKKFQVFLPQNEAHALTDDTVSIQGLALGEILSTDTNSVTVLSEAVVPSNLRKVAALLVNFPTITFSSTPDVIRTNIFDIADNYYRENSFGKWGFVGKYTEDGSGDVFGPYNIAFSGSSCDTATIQSQAKAAAVASGKDLSGYNSLVYFFPNISSCNYGGSATVGGTAAYVNMNGTASQGTITHELGHNMGAHHASSISCTENSVRVTISERLSSCTLNEYGDPFDVMGTSSGMKHFNNYHKGITVSSLNWLTTSNTQTIDRNTQPDGVYTIAPIEQVSSNVQSLRIPITFPDTTTPHYYYVEFRQPFGFDNFTSTSPAVNGVILRDSFNYNTSTQSRLLDATPETTSYTDAPLLVGKTFTDPYRGINVVVQSITAAGAQVRVYFGALACSTASPTISANPPSQTASPGTTLAYTITVKNNDTGTCGASNYNIIPTLPAGFLQSPETVTVNDLAPGASFTTTVNVTAPDTASGTNNFSEKVTNTANTSYSATTSASFVIVVPDTSAPVVTITSPANGATVPTKGNLKVSATANDSSGISAITLSMDGIVIKTCSNVSTCTVNYSSTKLTKGSHTVTATAADKASPANTSTTSVQVIK